MVRLFRGNDVSLLLAVELTWASWWTELRLR